MKELTSIILSMGRNWKVTLIGAFILAFIFMSYEYFNGASETKKEVKIVRKKHEDCEDKLKQKELENIKVLEEVNYNRALRQAIDSINKLRSKLDE